MKNKLAIILFLTFISGIMYSCTNRKSEKIIIISTNSGNLNNPVFDIKRGINISHWLSQNTDLNIDRENYFKENDVKFLAQNGFDHLRIPIDEENLWNNDETKQDKAFQLLHNAVTWCRKYNLKIIIDLHSVRSHSFNKAHNLLWESKEEQAHFMELWRQLSSEFKKYPNNLVAYELLNEPVSEKASSWNELALETIKEIRKNEPNRIIVLGSNRWQSPDTFHELSVPQNDKKIILSFHFYVPMILTHYRASWMEISKYTGSVNYPGLAVDTSELSNYGKDVINEVNKINGVFNRDTLLKLIQEPIRVANEYGLQLYCGEFGCLPTVYRSTRLKWYKDARRIFETNGIAWSNWDYKGGFAIFNKQTGNPDYNLISLLTGN